MRSLFVPESVAVIGASEKVGSVGGAVFRNLLETGFTGPVYAVNAHRGLVHGRESFAALHELPQVPELAVICTAAAGVPDLVRECGVRGVRGVIVISAGFREAGAAGRAMEDQLRLALAESPHLRMIGPNCLGVLRTENGLNASFAAVPARKGRLTLLSQSGALCTAILDWADERDIGFATCVSMGNMVNVGMADLVDYFAHDDETDALLLYIEGLTDAPRFLEAARACSQRKPIIAYKAGRFAESAAAAASHTGALASSDAVYDVAFRRAGVERAHSIEELFDCARLLVGQSTANGDRLGIITNAGGPGVMASDAWLALHRPLAKLSVESRAALDAALPVCWSHGNPVDVLGDATVDRYRLALRTVLSDSQVDAVLVLLTPQTMTDPAGIAQAVVAAKQATSKPVVASWMGGASVRPGRDLLSQGGVPVFDFPEEAVLALHHVVSTAECRVVIPPLVTFSPVVTDRIRETRNLSEWRAELARQPGLLGEVRSKQLLSDFGIPVVPTHVAHSAEEAIGIAERVGYPVVLKILSPDISHKTDVGGVLLGQATAASVRCGYDSMLATVRQRIPRARIDGVVVQPMVTASRGVELLLGMNRDPQFGPVLLIGAGGVTAELQKDTALELLPLDTAGCDRMLRSLRLYPLLEGYRGRPGVHLPKLYDVVARFLQMVEAIPELVTAEINPLLATRDDVIALDARLIAGPSPAAAVATTA